nr:MAG TPA_asm: hypothetical protein [Caudoviricetes sp.]
MWSKKEGNYHLKFFQKYFLFFFNIFILLYNTHVKSDYIDHKQL